MTEIIESQNEPLVENYSINQNNNQNNGSQTKLILLIGLVVLLIGGIGTGLYFYFNSDKSTANSEENYDISDENSLNADISEIKDLVQNWNDAHNSQDIGVFSTLFSNTVLFYQTQLDKNTCVEKKLSLFKKYPKFHQQIIGEIDIDFLDNNEIKSSFTKQVTIKNKTTDYPSYLIFRNIDGLWKIVTESDLITDKNLAKKTGGNQTSYECGYEVIDDEENGDSHFIYYNTATAIYPRVYFHTQLSTNSKSNAYIVSGQKAELLECFDEFVKVRFEYKGNVTIGYLLKDEVELE